MSDLVIAPPPEMSDVPQGEVLPPERGLSPQTIRLINVRNPLMPSSSRIVLDTQWTAGKTLYEYLEEQPTPAIEMIVSLNGGIVLPEDFRAHTPRPGDCIVVSPAVLGGGVWRTLAQVAVMAAAVAASVFLGPEFVALGWAATTTMGTVMAGITAGMISVGGGLLIQTFLGASPSSKAQTPSYAFQGPKSLAQSGTVIPKGYGTFMSGGNVIASFIDIEGQNQYINALVCYGFGPARSITDIQVNGKGIYNYQNVEQYVRYGTNDQVPIPGFNRIVNGYPQEVQVTYEGGPVIVPGTGSQTQALQVDIEFPTGVFYITGDGNQVPCKVVYKVEYAVGGSGAWQSVIQPRTTQDVVIYHSDGTVNTSATPTWGLNWLGAAPGTGVLLDTDNGPHTPGDTQSHTETIVTYEADGSHSSTSMTFQGEWQPINTALNQVEVLDWMNGWVQFVDSTTEPVYNRTSIYGLAPNTYDVRVTKWGSNNADNTVSNGDYDSPHRGQEVWIHSVNEITYQDLAYPNMILVGVRALATNQLSGADISITAVIQYGLRTLDENILPAALQAYEEDNPACIAADMMLDPLYGGGQFPGILPSNIERFIDEWLDWADLNDELVNAQGNVSGVVVATAGSGQVPGNYTLDSAGGGGTASQIVVVVNSGGTVTAAPTLVNPGEGFSAAPTFTMPIAAGGTPATFTASIATVSIRRHVFNGVIDNEDNLWNQVQMVCRMSRAAVLPVGRDYGVFVDQDDDPVQMFTMGNILQDSFQETWLALDDRANQIEVQFADSTRFYKQDNPIVYMDPADMAAGVEVKNVRVDGKGITIPAQAWHLGHFKGLSNKLLLRTGQFKADTDAIACRPGNVVILQHDVPEWGWGGRTLTSATTTSLPVDRNDLPWDGVTAYNVIVLFPSIQRYSGVVTFVAADIDSSGLNIGTLVSLSSFSNTNRVTRAVIAGVDCPILSATAGQVLVTLPPGFTPSAGQAYVLYDTDVMETAAVSGVAQGQNGTMVLALGSPFSQAPTDYSVYFYGQPGAQKLVRVSAVRKASEFRSTVEWIDFDANCYTDATPVVGETTAQITTNPGVTNLTVKEVFTLQSQGSYEDFAVLNWTNGPNTAGVGIYGSFAGGSTKLLARLTGYNSSWKYQVAPNVTWVFTVVGFDNSNDYAGFATAPSVTFTGDGITQNLLLGSSFQSGFTYWNTKVRSGDSLVSSVVDDGIATYTVASTTLTVAQTFATQVIAASKWSIGTELMLSAYFATAGSPVGNLVADIVFTNSSLAIISTARAVLVMAGAAATLTRVNTALTAVPSGTVQVGIRVSVDGGSLSLPAGVALTASHLLLEIGQSGQTAPSTWADIDARGNVIDIFQGGSSSSLRTQASTLPITTGSLTYAVTTTTATISWTNLVIKWPDGGFTFIQDGSLAAVTGLSASTNYWAFLYWDVVNAAVTPIPAATAVGTPAYLGTAYDGNADAECKQDGRVPLTIGGLQIATTASGGGGGTGGGGGASCTLRGTHLQTSEGKLGNEEIAERVKRGGLVWLVGRNNEAELIKRAEWVPVEYRYYIEVEGFEPFSCSESHTLFAEDIEAHVWCSRVCDGAKVLTVAGYRPARITRIDSPGEVLSIELFGPMHEYLVEDGVLTHNIKWDPPLM